MLFENVTNTGLHLQKKTNGVDIDALMDQKPEKQKPQVKVIHRQITSTPNKLLQTNRPVQLPSWKGKIEVSKSVKKDKKQTQYKCGR